MTNPPTNWQNAIQAGARSIKATWPPMLAIQLINAVLVVAYFTSPAAAQVFDQIGDFKDRTGLPFIVISGFLAGSVLPEIAKIAIGRVPNFTRAWLSNVTYTGFVYAVIAYLVYNLYFAQVILFGDTLTFATTAYKVLFDMLVFSPFLSIPFATGLFRWRKSGFKFAEWKQVIIPKNYARTVLPSLILCWGFWTPVLCAVYCLPMRLQFPIAIICEAAWAILFVFTVDSNAEVELQDLPIFVE